jgi:hypothetical protein
MPNNIEQLTNLCSNIIVLSKQAHGMAHDQFNAEFDAGSRSQSRSVLLCEIGSCFVDIEGSLKKIISNIDLLNEIPQDYTIKEDNQLFLMR